MGTRGAYGFFKDGINKVSYNHFDSYPSGLGAEVMEFIKATPDDQLGEVFSSIVMVNENDMPTVEQIDQCKKFANLNVGSQRIDDWYCLLREAQGNLSSLRNGLRYMIDNKDFLADSLFCEWAYIINLDTRKLEVYKGFNKSANGKGRYAALQSRHKEYYGVDLIVEIDISAIRVHDIDAMTSNIDKIAYPEEEE